MAYSGNNKIEGLYFVSYESKNNICAHQQRYNSEPFQKDAPFSLLSNHLTITVSKPFLMQIMQIQFYSEGNVTFLGFI